MAQPSSKRPFDSAQHGVPDIEEPASNKLRRTVDIPDIDRINAAMSSAYPDKPTQQPNPLALLIDLISTSRELSRLFPDPSAMSNLMSRLGDDDRGALVDAWKQKDFSGIINSLSTLASPTLSPKFTLDDIKFETTRFLNQYADALRSYTCGEHHVKYWTPPTSLEPSSRNRILGLRIPAKLSAPNEPDLLLHQIGTWRVFMRAEIDALFADQRDKILVNTSGSGKTSLLWEGCCDPQFNTWGFYFSCSVNANSNPYGSSDLTNAMDVMLPDLGGFTAVLDIDNDSSDVQVKVGINEDLAKRSFLIVLYVRLCVFDAFLDSVSGLGMDLARMKKLWLMLQISSSTLGFGSDIFLDFAKSLRPSPPEPLRTAIDLLRSRIYEQHKIPGIFLIVDEAQAAVGSTSKAFLDKKSEVHRPALRALAQFWSKYTEAGNCRLSMVFSGTGLSFDDMNETLSSGIGKPEAFVLCTHTGSFSKLDDIRKYVRSYIPDVDEHFIRRIMWWLRGRYRFTAGLIEFLLLHPDKNRNALFNTYIHHHTGTMPSDEASGSDLDLTEAEPVRVQQQSLKAEFVKLNGKQYAKVKALLNVLVMRYVVRGATITLTHEEAQLVELGFARYSSHNSLVLDEPLVLLAATAWFEAQSGCSLSDLLSIQLRAVDAQGKGLVGEDYLALSIPRALSQGTLSLAEILDFPGIAIPEFALHPVQLVALVKIDGEVSIRHIDVLRHNQMHPAIGFGSKGHLETLEFLKDSAGVPVLLPDNNMGPDLLMLVKIPKIERCIWLAIQLKMVQQGNMGPAKQEEALRTLVPDRFYTTKKGLPFSPVSSPYLRDNVKAAMFNLPNGSMWPSEDSDRGKLNLLRVLALYPAKAKISNDPEDDSMEHPFAILNHESLERLTSDCGMEGVLAAMKRRMNDRGSRPC